MSRLPHVHISQENLATGKTKRTFDYHNGSITVQCFTRRATGNLTDYLSKKDGRPVKNFTGYLYNVRIKRSPTSNDTVNYSLYNLGIQGLKWSVVITKIIKGQKVTFIRPKKGKESNGSAKENQKIRGPYDGKQPLKHCRRLRRIFSKKENKPLSERVWFLNFQGDECELELLVLRFRQPKPPAIKDGHDVSPPPPDAGGGEGEDGEGNDGDGEEEDGDEGDPQ